MNAIAKLISLSPILIALATGCTAPAGGKWPRKGVVSPRKGNPPATTIPAKNLEMQLASERESYVLGEPVYLGMRLKNGGSQVQRLVGSVDPVDGAAEVFVRGPDKRQVKFVPLVEADHDAGIFIELAAGDTLGTVVPVFFGANGWTFASVGRYELMVVYHSPVRKGEILTVKSAILSIEIKPAADGSGAFLIGKGEPASNEAGKFMVWQAGDHLVRGREHLEILLSRWSNSPLADYIHSAFARSYGNRFTDYRKRQVRPPDCARAMEHLGRATDDRLPTYVRLQNHLTRARCALREGKTEGAQAELKKARDLAGNRLEYRAMLKRIEEVGRNVERQKPPAN